VHGGLSDGAFAQALKYLLVKCKTLAYYSAGVVVVNSKVVRLAPGANPTIAGYNASIINFYSASNCMACFHNKNYFSLA
jgi:hypothetical protein